jgi:tRNA-specific adenosine deaminase 1
MSEGGDASTRLLASVQDEAIALLKDSAPPHTLPSGAISRGRDGYSLYGVLRTKPGRADSPPTLCMSCSDKIAAWNVLGIQGAMFSHLFRPVYLAEIIIGDVDQDKRIFVREDCERALWGRLTSVQGHSEIPIRVSGQYSEH